MKIPGFRIEGVVHESHPRIILRGVRESDGRPLVLKTVDAVYPSIRHVTEIEREYQITRRLAGVPGVIQTHDLVKYGSGNLAIVMEPFGRSLADLLIERDGVGYTTRTFLPMALSMAAILGRIHQHGVVHKDVVPRNILLRDGEVCFIDFGISSRLADAPEKHLKRAIQTMLPVPTAD